MVDYSAILARHPRNSRIWQRWNLREAAQNTGSEDGQALVSIALRNPTDHKRDRSYRSNVMGA